MSEGPRRIKIIAGKEPHKAQIIDTKTGEDLAQFVTSIVIRIDPYNGYPIAQVEFVNPEIEINADLMEETTIRYKRLKHGLDLGPPPEINN